MKFFSLLFLLLTLNAFAQHKDEDENKPFSAEAELGVLLTSGNTDTMSAKASINIKHNMAKWKNNYVLEGFSKTDEVEFVVGEETVTEDQRTAERYFASFQTDRKLNDENRGLFMFGSYEEDHFSGYNYQGTLAAGYSDRLFKTENSRLDYSIGPGVSFTETEETFENDVLTPSESRRTGVIRLSTNYRYIISDTAKFNQTIASDIAMEANKNTKTKSETSVTVTINSSLAFKAGYTVVYNSEVPADIGHSDTITSVTLVYSH